MSDIKVYDAVFKKRGDNYSQSCLFYPLVRFDERQTLIKLLEIKPGQILLDYPSGTGNLSEDIKQQFSTVKLLCAEIG